MKIEPLTGLNASTIQGVIDSLDKIVEWSKKTNKRTGYFAALYRKVTIQVQKGIENSDFDDGVRMERLDVIFANRYLQAFESYHQDLPVSDCWRLAFDNTEKWAPIVLQHLMLGMNAHINLDLGVAAAQTVEPSELPDLKPDFEKINTLLASLVNEVQNELSQIWPAFRWIDKVVGKADEVFADKSMAFSRDRAWALAEEYTHSTDQPATLKSMDKKLTMLGSLVVFPFWRLRIALLAIRITERGNVVKKIEILS